MEIQKMEISWRLKSINFLVNLFKSTDKNALDST